MDEEVPISQAVCEELLAALQGSWENVDASSEFYEVSENTVTRARKVTGEVSTFENVLHADLSSGRLRWGIKGKFFMQVDVWGHQLEEVSWIPSDEAEGSGALDNTFAGGRRCWRWRRTPRVHSPRIVPPPSWVSKASAAQLMRTQSKAAPSKAAPKLRGSVALSCCVEGTNKAPTAPQTAYSLPKQDDKRTINALQGLWANKEQSREVYEVRGLEVLRMQEGGVPRTFPLHWNTTRCRLEWGIGRYELIPPSMEAPVQVVWHPLNGGRGFVWQRLHAGVPKASSPRVLHQGVRVVGVPRPPGLPPPMHLLDSWSARQRPGPY